MQKDFICFASTAKCSATDASSETVEARRICDACRCSSFHCRLIQQRANVAASTPIVNAPTRIGPRHTDPILVTYMRHPKRRLGNIESYFARLEKCGAEISSVDMSGLHVDDALRLLSSTHVFLSNLGSAVTWTLFMTPATVAWVIVPGNLREMRQSIVARPGWAPHSPLSPQKSAFALWRANLAVELARWCFQCVGAQLGGVSFVFQLPVKSSFTLEVDGQGITRPSRGQGDSILTFYGNSPLLNLTMNEYGLGWAVVLRLIGQELEAQDREVLIHGLSEPSWTDSTALSDVVKAYIWPQLPLSTEKAQSVGSAPGIDIRVQPGIGPAELDADNLNSCAAVGVLEAHRPSISSS